MTARKDKAIYVRVDGDQHDWLHDRANRAQRTVSGEIRFLIEKERRHDLEPAPVDEREAA